MIATNTKLEMILAELKRCETAAIADGSYEMPTQKALCKAIGIGRCYFRSGTEPAQIAYAALMAAQERLDQLSTGTEKVSGKDTNLERCCGCFNLKTPALSRPARVYGKSVIQHLCQGCLDKRATKNNQRVAA